MNLKVIFFVVVEKDIELVNVPRRLAIKEILFLNEIEDLVNEPEKREGNFLVCQVFLNKKVLEPCQRRSFSKNHCKSTSKICNVIMDGGRTINLISKELV